MDFEIRMNNKSIMNEEREGNFLLILGEKEECNGEIIQEIWEEFSINTIVDGKKIIKEINQFDSIDDYYSSLEEIDDENVNRIEDA